MSGGLQIGAEDFNNPIEQKIKVSEITEGALSHEQKENFKDVLLTLEQVDRLKQNKLTIQELTGLQLEQHKTTIGGTIETGGTIIDNFTKSEEGKKTIKVVSQIKNTAEEIGAQMTWEKLEKIPVLGFFFKAIKGFIDFLKGFFGFKDTIKKVKEGVDDTLSEEKIIKTKENVYSYLLDHFGEDLTKDNKTKLKHSIENLSEEQLVNLNKKLLSGNMNINDIVTIVPDMFKDFFSELQRQKIEKSVQNKIIKKLQKNISDEYGTDFSGKKGEDLIKLIRDNYQLSDSSMNDFLKIYNTKEVLYKDSFSSISDIISNGSSIFIGLISKDIIPITDVALNIAESGLDVIKLSIGGLGINKVISKDIFEKEINKLTPEEKTFFAAILYRKGGLFFNILGSISSNAVRFGIESSTKTTVKTTSLLGASLNSNYSKQVKHFEEIAKIISPNTLKDVNNILQDAINNSNKIQQNYKILDILSKNKDTKDITKIIKQLEDIGEKIPKNITPSSSIDDIYKTFSGKHQVSTGITDKGLGFLKSKFGFGANADLFKFNQRLEKISIAQKAMFEGGKIGKLYGKYKELINIGKISRLGDKLTLHFESKDAAKQAISKWNILANSSPELIKGLFDKLPIIAIAGLSAESDKPFFEDFQEQLKYLFPIIGPILIMSDSGFKYNEKTGSIEGINTVEAGIAGVLFTIDGFFLAKEIISKKLGGFGYIIKPLKDIYQIGRGTAEGLSSLGKAAHNGKSFSSIAKKAIEKTKHLQQKPKLRILAILGTAGYLGYEAAFADDTLEKVFGEDGKIDKIQLKQEIGNLSDADKTTILEYLLTESSVNYGLDNIKGLNISIIDNKLNIISENENIQGDWLINNKILELLQLNPQYTFEYKKTA